MDINVKNLNKMFVDNEGNKTQVLNNLSLNIEDKTFYTMVGANGSGKTTLLNTIAGIETQDSGSITADNLNNSISKIGYVWQSYRESLLPWFSAEQNIAFPLKINNSSLEFQRNEVSKILEKVRFQLDKEKPVYQLSGGQQQMTCILRSLIIKPDLLLLDEPFSALDQQTKWEMTSLVEQIWLEEKLPVVFVSHDIDESILLADKILLMSKSSGKIGLIIDNTMKRPRNVTMLSSEKHLRIRTKILDFLYKENIEKN